VVPCACPGAHQRRLTESGGCRDQNELTAAPDLQALQEAGRGTKPARIGGM
jgi:hypothetical protein